MRKLNYFFPLKFLTLLLLCQCAGGGKGLDPKSSDPQKQPNPPPATTPETPSTPPASETPSETPPSTPPSTPPASETPSETDDNPLIAAPVIFPNTSFENSEYSFSGTFDQINLSSAYSRGITGKNIVIAIGDTGINKTLEEFEGQILDASTNLVNDSDDITDKSNHGTLVASIIGAKKNNLGVHGIAFDAKLLVFKLTHEDNKFDYSAILKSVDIAKANNAKVYNMSFGEGTAITSRTILGQILTKTQNADIVSVLAAGNNGTDNPDYSAQAANNPLAKGSAIIVGAVDKDNIIAKYSARAGDYSQYFLVAPGNAIAIGNSGHYYRIGGTSFATPHVSAAAALLRSQWPQLSASQTVEILLKSATDLGEKGVDRIYGNGLLNIAKAVQPIGYLTTKTISGAPIPLDNFKLSLSPIFGTAKPVYIDIIGLDNYGRDFKTNLQLNNKIVKGKSLLGFYQYDNLNNIVPTKLKFKNFTMNYSFISQSNNEGSQYINAIVNNQADHAKSSSLSFKFNNTKFTLEQGNLYTSAYSDINKTHLFASPAISSNGYDNNIQGNKFSISQHIKAKTNLNFNFQTSNSSNDKPIGKSSLLNIGTNYSLFGADITNQIGFKQESNLLLGSQFDTNLLNNFRTKTQYIYFSIDNINLGNAYSAFANFTSGKSMTSQGDGLIGKVSSIEANEWSIGLIKSFRNQSKFGLALHQPLVSTSGVLDYNIPTSYDYTSNSFSYETIASSLRPEKTENALLLSYSFVKGPLKWQFNATNRFNAFHQSNNNVVELQISLSQAF